jgi:hypothetical protein
LCSSPGVNDGLGANQFLGVRHPKDNVDAGTNKVMQMKLWQQIRAMRKLNFSQTVRLVVVEGNGLAVDPSIGAGWRLGSCGCGMKHSVIPGIV